MIYTTRKPRTRVISPFNHLMKSINGDMDQAFTNTVKETSYTKPAVNVTKYEDYYRLAVALPGLQKKDISLKLEDGRLWISADINQESDADYKRREFRYGKFQRSFILPDNIDIGKIEAKMENGILHITLPLIPEPMPQKIEIQ